MRSQFHWYFPVSDEEISSIWKDGTVTFDANVLLDLYRFHENTRKAILDAVNYFEDRVWLSNQAAKEFFKNRKVVITGSDKDFREGKNSLDEIRKSTASNCSNIRSNRLIDRAIVSDLESEISAAILKASDRMSKLHEGHPDFLKSDPVLENITSIFDGRVGSEPSLEELEGLFKEGERRVREKIPPGFLDQAKDGVRPYGDFILWRQTLDQSKMSNKPMILVTSERKEDWWERHSGRTVGPRMELLREAYEYSGNRILLYHTEAFVEEFGRRFGARVDPEAVAEIREANDSRRLNPAISFNQHVEVANEYENSGMMEIELLRPVHNVSAMGRIEPPLILPAKAKVSAVVVPEGASPFVIRSSPEDEEIFHIHVHSSVRGEMLKVGSYSIKYYLDPLDDFSLDIPEGDVNPTE